MYLLYIALAAAWIGIGLYVFLKLLYVSSFGYRETRPFNRPALFALCILWPLTIVGILLILGYLRLQDRFISLRKRKV